MRYSGTGAKNEETDHSLTMRKIFLIFLSIIMNCATSAQSTFMEIFRGTGTVQADLGEMTNANVLAGMSRGRGFSLFNPQGEIIRTQVYVLDTFLAMQSVQRYSDNEFYFVGGYHKDTCTAAGLGVITKIYPVIGKMDSLGNISQTHHYALDPAFCTNMAGDLSITQGKEVIAWGSRAMFFALKTDSLGSPLWAKRFSERGGFQFLKELPGGDLLAGINMETAGAVVARMDADGNFLWLKSYIRPKGMVHDAVIVSDSSFVITGFTDSLLIGGDLFPPPPQQFHPKLFMMKLNGTGEVQWCRGYESEYNWVVSDGTRIVHAQDGNHVVLSNIRTQNSARPFLMKTDQNGDTLWTRSSGRNDYSYETNSLLAYSDGSFIYNGRVWGTMPDNSYNNWAFLYKADSLGHLPCVEEYHPVQVVDLFPTDSSFTLTSFNGAVAFPAFIEDTTYIPIEIYDECQIVTAILTSHSRAHQFHIRPNPNTGQFIMEFADPLLRESYYSVYDPLGKLLFQRPLAVGATLEEVDLSRFGKGTYVIKITDPEGIRHERVVLE